MAQSIAYSMVVRTRYLYPGPLRADWAIADGALVYTYFDDTDGLTVALKSNNGRLVGSCTWSQNRQSGLAASNLYRHAIWIGAREGLDGNFFDVTTTKVVPSDGDVEYEGVQLELEAMEREHEFQDGTDALTGQTTFVVQADASPEDNAYD